MLWINYSDLYVLYTRRLFLIYQLVGLLLFFCTLLYSQDSNFRISDDDMSLQLDKKAHLWVSFGIYYFFYTGIVLFDSTTHSQLDAMILTTIVGLTYEVFQGTSLSNADGFSKEDMYYNLMGVTLGRVSHDIILFLREII